MSAKRRVVTLPQILQALVLAYQILAVFALVILGALAARWLPLPFLGAFVEQTLVFNGVGQHQPAEAWGLYLDESLRLNYQLVAIDGVEVRNAAQIQAVLRSHTVGEQVVVQVQRIADGARENRLVVLQPFPPQARRTYFYIPYLVGLLYAGIGLWMFGLRRSEPAGRAFALFATSLALLAAGLLDVYTTHTLTLLWTVALGIGGASLFELAMVFPEEVRWLTGRRHLAFLGYFLAVPLIVWAAVYLRDFQHPTQYIICWRALYLFNALTFLYFSATLVVRAFLSHSPVVRRQATTLLLGMIVALGPLAVWLLWSAARPLNFPTWLLAPTVLFPLVIAYVLLRQRLVRTDYLMRRALLYSLLSVLVLGGYAFLVAGLGLIFGDLFRVYSPYLVGALVFLLAVFLNPLRNRLQHWVDTVFFRTQAAYQQRVQDFTHELTKLVDLEAILQAVRRQIETSLFPQHFHIFLYDTLNDQYVATAGEDGRPTSDVRFHASSPLVRTLSSQRVPLFLDLARIPDSLQSERARLMLLGATLFLPLPGERLIGWLALGPKHSGEIYTGTELNYLDMLASQAAVAIERAQVTHHMERRVREMNILARLAQGVNITISFDDMLELIYAQTDQALPVDDMHITLYNAEAGYYYFAFCLENDVRLPERENKPLPAAVGLSREVIRSRRPIVTTDYANECRERGVTPSTTGIYAWAGVPLNAGAETIGALTIASRDPNVVYTPTQIELLQSIANQAAGAIVKARLLQETERRARQLATLNEITRQLTGTLETGPLLQRILESAVSILNCEAGTLFLVDEQTDELVFQEVISPVAHSLIGKRLPPGSGIAGKAAQTQSAIIENDVLHSTEHFDAVDKQTGFVSRALIAVPLIVKERVIGVLEVINRKDGLPFSEDDKNLLMAFASQAAVAIENARLYTLTDQELSARVEELSVMQRIDRELNASLDVTRAMRITLDWAMRQSAAEAGLIGIVQDGGLRLMAQTGYDELQEQYQDSTLPLEQLAGRAAVESGQPQYVILSDEQRGLLAKARSQLTVPIRRETNIIGLIVLESLSADSLPEQALNFLTRLSDHAAIAIANAQLYAEVQAANIAKSDFISFVAHELKNPMTSIKGYTELLAAGAVGPINENQANFLNTIRSNVERMATLVSDLNDNSKIEVGRLRLEFKAVDLPEVVDEIVRSMTRQVEEKKQTLTVQLADDLPKVWADRTRLAQVLVNLVSNAHKYTPEGGHILVAAERSPNRWDPQGAVEVVHIWVQDDGIGISPEDQKKIFQKFFRSDDAKAREAPGTGLGLNITKSLVEMQGGRIWFESEYRKGTTFHFTVPVAEEA